MTDITTTRGRPETGAPTTYDQRAVAPTRWSADADRTSVDFAVKTFWGLLTVRGHFDRFSGSYEVGSDGARIELTIDADSLDTGNAKRDKHLALDRLLRGRRQVRFASTRVRESGDGRLRVELDRHDLPGGVEIALDAQPSVAGLANAGRREAHLRVLGDREEVGRAQVLVALRVPGVEAVGVDRELDPRPVRPDLVRAAEAVEVAANREQAPEGLHREVDRGPVGVGGPACRRNRPLVVRGGRARLRPARVVVISVMGAASGWTA